MLVSLLIEKKSSRAWSDNLPKLHQRSPRLDLNQLLALTSTTIPKSSKSRSGPLTAESKNLSHNLEPKRLIMKVN
jgi:hypothetical protein